MKICDFCKNEGTLYTVDVVITYDGVIHKADMCPKCYMKYKKYENKALCDVTEKLKNEATNNNTTNTVESCNNTENDYSNEKDRFTWNTSIETGMVRRIDDVGRIAIPKDIRKPLGIQEGQPFEFFIGSGSIILRPYNTIMNGGEQENETE